MKNTDFSKYVTVLFIALVQLLLLSKRNEPEPSQHLNPCFTFFKADGTPYSGFWLKWAFSGRTDWSCRGTGKGRGEETSPVASRVPMLRILLTNTKVPRSTKVLVASVKEKIMKVQHLHHGGVEMGAGAGWEGSPHELLSPRGGLQVSQATLGRPLCDCCVPVCC